MLEIAKLFEIAPPGTVTVTYRPGTNIPPPFAFVLNVSRLEGKKAIGIAPGLTLRRATNEEIKFVKEILNSAFGSHFSGNIWETQRPKPGGSKYVTLPAKQWRYFVIEIAGGVGEIKELELLEWALSIAQRDLDIGAVALKVAAKNVQLPAYIYRPPQLFQSLSALSSKHYSEEGASKTISKADGKHLGDIYARLQSYDHSVLDLRTTFRQLLELKDLPHFSPLQILGYFAILEALLTHKPDKVDPYDSITRQIKQKLALLNKRWEPSLNYSDLDGASHETIWSRMYEYRSDIAHGTIPDFSSKSLKKLKSKDAANALLKDTVKQTIRQCLIEPQLVADLRNC